MASLYKRERSPYLWIKYIDESGKRRQESTKFRSDVSLQVKQARQLRDDLTAREVARKGEPGEGPDIWAAWVPRFIRQRYGGSDITRTRAEQVWNNVSAYFSVRGIAVPRQLDRNHVRDFIDWRQEAHGECGTYKAAKNTALTEVKFMALIMDEAVACGFAPANPCRKMGIRRDEPKTKPRITESEHRLITRALKDEPEWMRVAYKIAWEQGCRLTETMIDLRNVNLAENVLGLRTKGKKKRVAEVPLNPRLRPLFRRLLGERPGFLKGSCFAKATQDRGKYTFEESDISSSGASKVWWKFFRRIGLAHLSFHCTRVSFITRCYEAGIPEQDVMRLCLHASATVHRIYPRLPPAGQHLQDAMKRMCARRAA